MINDESRKAQGRPVSDEQSNRPESVFLGLGSNLGDREANLSEAIERVKQLGLSVVCASSIYETEPVGYLKQAWFLNQVIEVAVDLKITFDAGVERDALLAGEAERGSDSTSTFWARNLLHALLDIERRMGRERGVPDGPRVIDIDILLYGGTVGSFTETPGNASNITARINDVPFLTLPHPRLHARRFVLEPLCEIAPGVLHPALKKTCRELLATLDDSSSVRLYKSSCQ